MSNTVNKEKLMEKVKKLLALAGNNPSQDEANAAYLKAQKLIAEYNLNMSECGEEKEEIITMLATHPNNNGYRTKLAVILARNFRCEVMMHSGVVMFVGYKADVEVCTEVFNHAYKVSRREGQRMERLAKKNGESIHGVFNSYVLGFCDGIKYALDKQCTALMIVVPTEVHDEVQRRSSGKFKGGMKMKGYNNSAYTSGLVDGREHMGRKHIEG